MVYSAGTHGHPYNWEYGVEQETFMSCGTNSNMLQNEYAASLANFMSATI